MLNAHCDLPTCEQPEIVPDSVPVVPSLLDEYRRVFDELGSTCINNIEASSGTIIEYRSGGDVRGHIAHRQDKDPRYQLYIEAQVGSVLFNGFILLSDVPRFKAAIRAALETE